MCDINLRCAPCQHAHTLNVSIVLCTVNGNFQNTSVSFDKNRTKLYFGVGGGVCDPPPSPPASEVTRDRGVKGRITRWSRLMPSDAKPIFGLGSVKGHTSPLHNIISKVPGKISLGSDLHTQTNNRQTNILRTI